MKKFFIVVFLLAVLVVTGIGIFIATFDANHYKFQIIQAIEKALGNRVRIGSLRLGWSNGLAFQVDQLAIYPAPGSADPRPIATLERANVRLKLGPLLRKKLEVVSISLVRPLFNLIKEENGSIRINGVNPPAKTQESPSTPSRTQGPFLEAFSIGTVRVENGEVGFVDRSSRSALNRIAVKKIDVLIKNLSFAHPVDFEAKFSMFSDSQNMSLKGRLLVASPQGPTTVQSFKLVNDLSRIKLSDISDAIPSVKSTNFVEPLRGNVAVELKRFVVAPEGLGDLEAHGVLKQGRVQVRSLQSAFDNVTLEADVRKNELEIKKFSSAFAQGALEATALSKNYLSEVSQTRVGFKADQLNLEVLLPAPKPGRPQLHGNLSMVFDGDAQGLSWSSISTTLNGSGRVILTDGLVVNLNLLRKIFDKLSKVPGVAEALNNYLSPAYRQKLAAPTTVLEPLDFNVNVVNGQLIFQELRLSSTGFQIVGAGQAGLDGNVDFHATLFLDPELSGILLSSVPNMRYVANSQGLVAVPVRLVGTVQNLSVEPDMDFILQRVLFEKGQEIVGKALEKALGKTTETAQSAAGEGGSAYDSILGKLLR